MAQSMQVRVSAHSSTGSGTMPRLLSPSIRKTANSVMLASPSAASTRTTGRPFTATFAAGPSTVSQRLTSASVQPTSEEATEPVFKASRAKKLFVQFDSNRDAYLSHAEFDAGLRSFIAAMPLQANDLDITLTPSQSIIDENGEMRTSLSQSQLDALFNEADHNRDNRLSLAEFVWRFGGGPEPVSESRLPTRIIQTLKRQVKDVNKISVDDVRAVLDSVYDGPKVRYKAVDLTKIEQVSNAGLKRILQQTLQAEKEAAAAAKRPMEDWAQHIYRLNGLTQKDVDKLFNTIDTKRSGRIDLGPIFAQCQLRPAKHRKNKKKNANPGYLLSTVEPEHCRDFINDCIFSHCLGHSGELHSHYFPYQYKCHPPLDHWGFGDRQSKSLAKNQSGYKVFLFLSERTKIKTMIKKITGYEIYCVFRTDLTELKRNEYLYYCCITLNEHEEFQSLTPVLKKSWRDGEVETVSNSEAQTRLLVQWRDYCGEDEEELSIPPLTLTTTSLTVGTTAAGGSTSRTSRGAVGGHDGAANASAADGSLRVALSPRPTPSP